MYTKPLAAIFQLAPLTKADWMTVAAFALPLVLLEEILKFGEVVRHRLSEGER